MTVPEPSSGLRPRGFWTLRLASATGWLTARCLPQRLSGSEVFADALPDSPEPLSEMDPYLRSALLTGMIHSLLAADTRDRAGLRVTIERVRQALRDILDERPVWRAGPKDAVLWLRAQGFSIADLSRLSGVSETSLRRWCSPADETEPSGEHSDRLVVMAKMVNHLRHAVTARGALQWLERPHPALDDRRAIDEVKDPGSYRMLASLALGARSSLPT